MKETPIKYQLNADPQNFLELWKWFTDDAAKIKDRMWTMATFFYTVLGALLGFVGKQLVSANGDGFIQQPDLVLVVALAGCVLSGYGIYMLWQYGKHIRTGWNRADYIRFRIEGLSEIWCFNDKELERKDEKHRKEHPESIPKVAVVLIILMAFFFLIYAGTLLLVLTHLKSQNTYLNMENLDIINTAIAATIPLLILFFGHRLDKRKREEQEAKQNELKAKEEAKQEELKAEKEAKQAEQNKIERIHADRIQFELAADHFGPQNGHYIVEIIMVLTNKGLVRKKLNELLLTIKGIEENTDIGLFLDLESLINIADFPEPLVKTNVLEKKVREGDKEEYEKKEWFVEPGIVQKFTYVARIPEKIRFILVRSNFKYHETSTHSAQRVFELNQKHNEQQLTPVR